VAEVVGAHIILETPLTREVLVKAVEDACRPPSAEE
jgi:hypothetical protein